MKYIMMVISLLYVINSYTTQEQENFLRAQDLAQKGYYKEALVLYDTIDHAGFLVWYNKGVCFYYLNNYLEAYIAFKKAALHSNNRMYEKTCYAIKKVAEKGNYTFEELWYQKVAKKLYHIPLLFIQILFVITLFFTLWYTVTCRFSYKTLLLSILMMLQFIYIVIMWYAHTCKQAVVVKATASYVGPSYDYQINNEISVGSTVLIDKKEKNWYKVKGLNRTGWVEDTALNMIE